MLAALRTLQTGESSAVLLPVLEILRSGPQIGVAGETGGGARIRTEKFGFGDRQFNR